LIFVDKSISHRYLHTLIHKFLILFQLSGDVVIVRQGKWGDDYDAKRKAEGFVRFSVTNLVKVVV
jgi:hypothetical protein